MDRLKKKKRDRRKKRMNPLVKLLILVLIIGGTAGIMSTSSFDVANFEIEGNSYYSDEEIMVMGDCKTGGNIFWGAGLSEIKERLSKDAYMEDVKVRRSLPSTVVIEITERKQTAAIVYGDNYVVIDQDGIVLRKTSVEPKITVIRGLTISKLAVGETIETEETVLFRQTMEMLAAMQKGDLYFKKVEISKVQIKAYIYDHLLCEGSPEDLMEAIDTGKLQVVMQELYEKDIERGTIKVSGADYISFTPEI